MDVSIVGHCRFSSLNLWNVQTYCYRDASGYLFLIINFYITYNPRFFRYHTYLYFFNKPALHRSSNLVDPREKWALTSLLSVLNGEIAIGQYLHVLKLTLYRYMNSKWCLLVLIHKWRNFITWFHISVSLNICWAEIKKNNNP